MFGNGKKIQLVWLLASVSLVSIVVISYLKASLELEDAEQAYYSQWWRLGYDDQPPLYTWIQKLINSLFGVSKFSFSFLRGLLFGATLLSLYVLAKRTLLDKFRAEIVVLGTALIPVFIDFTFRRLSHTLLLCLIVLLAFLVIQLLVDKKSMRNYALLGICFGLGMLTKYNYSLFLLALLAASFFDVSLKQVVWNRKILMSSLIALLLFSPHFYWLLKADHVGFINDSLRVKLETDTQGILILTPMLEIVKALLEIYWPIILISVVLILLKRARRKTENQLKWLVTMGLVQIAVFLLFFVFLDVQEIHSRWLLPMLLPFLILLINELDFTAKSIRKWGIFIFLLVICFQILRTPAERLLGIPSDIHFDYSGLSKRLNEAYSDAVWVLPNVTYGGQIRLLNPNRELFTLDDFSIRHADEKIKKQVVVSPLNDFFDNLNIKDSLLQYGPEKEHLYFFEVNSAEIPFYNKTP